jgi:uncharacterized protein YuzE
MKMTYHPEVDVVRIIFSSAPVEESDEDKLGVILDYDKDGNIVGLEVLDASKRIENPRPVEYAVATWSCNLELTIEKSGRFYLLEGSPPTQRFAQR